MWAITCFFNPHGYRNRLRNYRIFRKHLAAPLVTVELAYGPKYELNQSDADILISRSGADVMWQKERLLNIALASLPSTCTKVAWLDSDVIFERADWVAEARALLDRMPMVHLFSHVRELGNGEVPGELTFPVPKNACYSVGHALSVTPPLDLGMNRESRLEGGCLRGLAWAAHKDLLNTLGFYDVCILGGADRAMVAAGLGQFDEAIRYLQMNEPRAQHFLRWAKARFAQIGGRIGVVNGGLAHLWHGSLANRQYMDRHRQFRQFDFNPGEDLVLDEGGCWRWNSNKPAMHQFVRNYFASRREDDEK